MSRLKLSGPPVRPYSYREHTGNARLAVKNQPIGVKRHRQVHRVVTPAAAGSSPAAPAIDMKYKVGDVVLVESFAGPKVRVRLKERVLKPKDFWGADGWDAQIIYKKDVDILRKNGVPYKKGAKPLVFVFDWQMIKRKC